MRTSAFFRPFPNILVSLAAVGPIATATVACEGHDAAGRIEVSARDCVVCHQPEYDATRDPAHASWFPDTCADCHGTTAWKPAQVDHARLTVPCAACHLDDYQASPFPGHDAFPTTCQDCHTTAAWRPATGGHPEARFPIARGDHAGIECLGCHEPTLGAWAGGVNTTCAGCHAHTRAEMDREHDEVRGYPGDDGLPSFCLRCHEGGREGDD